jgi:hypothetical protein
VSCSVAQSFDFLLPSGEQARVDVLSSSRPVEGERLGGGAFEGASGTFGRGGGVGFAEGVSRSDASRSAR